MGKPLSAAHKAAISKSLKARNGGKSSPSAPKLGGRKLGGAKLGGAKLSKPAAPAAPKSDNSELHSKQRAQVLKGLRTRGTGTFDRKQVRDALDISPRDFNRAIKELQDQGAISTSQRRITIS
ncbi:winged helix-turn-helix domain-containing protein [Rhodococcoides fascians]|uniref:winged helix-turn-helix domain-containing protein n=1 Tax=Rhodococcoides fascians TaxID=1828 RepID=UPI00050CD7C3|nr:winged helix-turn-helix domain-containing protein [Rhodococcus fascians]